jgi:glycosyltransferase involved in cell wall biosynthesis
MPIIDPANIRVVPNTVRIPNSAECEETVATSETVRVLFLATLMPTKGYRELVTAVHHLINEGFDITLDLAGEPWSDSDARWLQQHLFEPGLRYHGPLVGEQKWRLMRETNVIAVPSTAPEGQPLTVLEAMATRHALIATAQGGIAETVGDAAVLLAPASGRMLVADLKQALRSMADPAARAGLTARAHQRFTLEFSADAYLERWLNAIVNSG